MIQRTILKDLQKWSQRKDRKPLILRGARQVGKTTVVNSFAKEFDQYIYLNLDVTSDRGLFEKSYEIDDLLSAIYLEKGIVDTSAKTLIFIDEIQNSAEAVKMLRYFYELKPELYIIAAGSLLETLMDVQVSFPVGRVEYAFLYPLTFLEYLSAVDQGGLLEAIKEIPIKKFAHDKLLSHFHRYVLIGGMPEIVATYLSNNEISPLNTIYEGLKNSYLDDVEKYASLESQRGYIRHAISSAPFEAGSRIKFQSFGKSNFGSREMALAIKMLEKAMIIDLAYPTTSTEIPAIPNMKRSPKLHFLDIGLVNSFLGLQTELISIQDLNLIYKGKITEQVVAQELKAIDRFSNKGTLFWIRELPQSNAEVDFIRQYKEFLIPIEVKSGGSGRLRSLHQFIDAAPHDYAVRICACELSIESIQTTSGKAFKLLNLPYYLTGMIDEYLEWFVELNR